MTHHPRGVISTPTPVRASTRWVALLAGLALAVTGCTASPPEPPVPPAPVLPAEQFPALTDRDPDVRTAVDAFAVDGADVVALATVEGRLSTPTFWHSADHGESWQQGQLSAQAAEQTLINEWTRDLVAVHRSGDERRWLALGAKDTDVIAWTSADGRTWDRSIVTGLDPAQHGFFALQGTNEGFVLVGTNWNADTNVRTPQAWTSPDGITWTGGTVPGEGEFVDVAVHDSTWVAVGRQTLPDRTDAGRRTLPLVHTSTDAGATWTRRDVPEPKGSGNFFTYLSTVAWTPRGFVAGGSCYVEDARAYAPWTLDSADGAAWQVGADVTRTHVPGGISEVVSTDKGILVIEEGRYQGASQVSVRAESVSGGWATQQIPRLDGESWTEAAVASGDALLWSVGTTGSRRDSRILRSTDRGGTWTELRLPVPEGTGPRVEPSELALREGVLTAWGNAQGATSVWTRGEDGTWGAPRVVRDEDRESFGQLFAGPHGWLITGSKQNEAQVLTSSDAETWHESGPGTFNEVAQYHSSSVNDAVWFRDRWVVVGNRTTNADVRRSAFVASSVDGQAWTEGKPSKTYHRGDSYGEDDRATDLDGLVNHGRRISGVDEGAGGLVATGQTTSTTGSRPAVWFSETGETWRLQELPFDGYSWGNAFDVLVHGDTVLAIGSGRVAGGTDHVPLVWRSTDGGTTFELGRVGDHGRYSGIQTAVDSRGFLLLIGRPGGETPLLWRSPDAVTWHSAPIEVPNAADGVEAGLRDVLVDGDTLLVLMNVTNRVDSVPVLVEVPLA